MSDYADYIIDHLSDWGPVSYKRMFGGHGIFRAGLMFALIADDQFYLKADDITADTFLEMDCEKFTYTAKNKPMQLNYWSAPDAFFEDADDTSRLADMAFDAALRADDKKSGKKQKS